MSNNCKNCGQPVLDTDTVCWHCGQALAATAVPKPAKAAKITAVPIPDDTLPLTAVAVYGALTAVLIIAMLLVMRSLSQKPLVLLNPATQARREWTPVTAHDQQFTLDLPVGWAWLESDQPRFAALMAEGGEWLETAVYPLAAIAEDADYRLVAMPDAVAAPTSGFIVVARSQRLGPVTAVQSVALVEESRANFDLVDADVVTSFTGAEVAQFLLLLPDTAVNSLRCRQVFVPATGGSYLVSGCAPEAEFGGFATIFADTLASFQPLFSNR